MSGLPSLELSQGAVDFIDDVYLMRLLDGPPPEQKLVQDIVAKSLDKQPLTVEETAILLRTDDPGTIEGIFDTAQTLKETVYGNRIVLFAPLYVGNDCVNDCSYCGFQSSNSLSVRHTLTPEELRAQVLKLESTGQKRLILVFGEHPQYDADFIAEQVRTVYGVKQGTGEIRRVNINAAPLDHEGYRKVKASGIGTYQIFQETYHHDTYARVHSSNTRKGNYLYRLDGLSRAFESGIDDMGIGVLFGLYDWRFEVLGLVAHSVYLRERYGVGPHTISFPRLRPACGVSFAGSGSVSDDDFRRVIATLRLAVPYTGLILTARENAPLRRDLMRFGVSQIDAGSRIEIGGYTEKSDTQVSDREQFELGDTRPLDVVMRELLQDEYLPSFCTACYRLGRTGEHFMEFAIPGFIKRYCTPNALTTLTEYLEDYATPETRAAGEALIKAELDKLESGPLKTELEKRLVRIKETKDRDLCF
jgi:2-iminoacetate synthase